MGLSPPKHTENCKSWVYLYFLVSAHLPLHSREKSDLSGQLFFRFLSLLPYGTSKVTGLSQTSNFLPYQNLFAVDVYRHIPIQDKVLPAIFNLHSHRLRAKPLLFSIKLASGLNTTYEKFCQIDCIAPYRCVNLSKQAHFTHYHNFKFGVQSFIESPFYICIRGHDLIQFCI